jgi:hypothetical protein
MEILSTMRIPLIPIALVTEMLADYDQWAHDVPATFRYKEIADFLALEAGLAREMWLDEDGNECCDEFGDPIWGDDELTADHSHEKTIVRL